MGNGGVSTSAVRSTLVRVRSHQRQQLLTSGALCVVGHTLADAAVTTKGTRDWHGPPLPESHGILNILCVRGFSACTFFTSDDFLYHTRSHLLIAPGGLHDPVIIHKVYHTPTSTPTAHTRYNTGTVYARRTLHLSYISLTRRIRSVCSTRYTTQPCILSLRISSTRFPTRTTILIEQCCEVTIGLL